MHGNFDGITDIWWGLLAPDGVTSAWGARAILENQGRSFALLGDRMSCKGADASERMRLTAWLDNKALPRLRFELGQNGYYGDDHHDVVIAGDGFRLVANGKRSFGYLYLGAWPDPTATGPTPAPKKLPKGRR